MYILIILLAGLTSILWFQGENLIYYSDFIFPVNRSLFFKQTLYSWIETSIGVDKLQAIGELVPFGLFVKLSQLFHISVHSAQKIWMYIMFTGTGLSMYFLATYALRDASTKYLSGLLAALLYMFNPWTATHFSFLWQHMVFIPLILGLYIKGLNENKGLRYLIGFAIVLWITSTTSITNMRAFVLQCLFMIFYFIYYIICNREKFKQALKFTLILFLVLFLISFYIFIPLMVNIFKIFKDTDMIYQSINFNWLDAFKLNSSSSPLESLRLMGSWGLTSGHRGYPYYYWYSPYKSILLIFIGFTITGLALFPPCILAKNILKKFHGLILFFLLLFIFGLLITLGQNNSLTLFLANEVKYFATIFSLPTFHGGMFLVIGLCILYSLGHNVITNALEERSKKWLLSIGFLALIIIYGFPVWSGQLIYPGNELLGSPRFKIPGYHYEFSEYIKTQKSDFKIFQTPYSKLSYFPSTWPPKGFGGHDITENMYEKPILKGIGITNQLADALNQDTETFNRMSSLFNIKYILHRQDANLMMIKENPWYVLHELHTLNDLFNRFAEKIKTYGLLDLYKVRDSDFLPHFYVPQEVIQTKEAVEKLPDIVSSKDYNVRSAVYFNDQNNDRQNYLAQLNNIRDLPTLEFKKINPTKYRIRVHQARESFPLIFSENFHDKWKVYVGKGASVLNEAPPSESYKILDDNEDDQATWEELKSFIAKKWISEERPVDFISKNFHGTIQNDNLNVGSWLETLFQKPLLRNQNHLMANGYANSWYIDLEEIRNIGEYLSNEDDSIDFELIVEFWPQRIYYIGLLVSGLTLLVCLSYLGYTFARAKKNRLI